MNTPHPDSTPGRTQAERQLQAGLRSTRPEFERRFEELRRRLANEPARGLGWRRFLFLPQAAWWRVSVGGLAACLALALAYGTLHRSGVEEERLAEYKELLDLNAALQDALPLTNPENLEVLLEMPMDRRS